MHYHCEIVLPPDTTDIDEAVRSVMRQFDEDPEDDEQDTRNAFWDFYVVGGRFAGTKQLAQYDQTKLADFEAWMRDENVTVSALQCGKPSLEPADQVAKVDAKWNEMFSAESWQPCPMFSHSNDQYGLNGRGTIDGDICPLRDAKAVKCSRVIFAGPSYDSETTKRTGPLEVVFMLAEDVWNGCNHMPVKWDQTIGDAVLQWTEKLKNYGDEFREQMQPTDDWITVTVDYHS